MTVLGTAAALLGVVVSVSTLAATPDQGPSATVRDALSKATAASADDRQRNEQLASLRAVARQLVDTGEMGRRAMGDAFSKLNAARQEEFLRLFDELVVRSYLQKLLLFRNPRFRFAKEAPRGDAVIVTTFVVTGEESYEVSYEMRQRDGQWMAADIVVEGVSMTSNYTDQFASLLRNRSVEELLDLVRRKVETFRAKDAKAE
jgi:phospholipid transport system substrate-binding protein